MRILETVSEITTFLTQDVTHILGEEDESRYLDLASKISIEK